MPFVVSLRLGFRGGFFNPHHGFSNAPFDASSREKFARLIGLMACATIDCANWFSCPLLLPLGKRTQPDPRLFQNARTVFQFHLFRPIRFWPFPWFRPEWLVWRDAIHTPTKAHIAQGLGRENQGLQAR